MVSCTLIEGTVAGFSISIFLPDGDPSGMRIATRSHWTGEAIEVTHTEYPEVSAQAAFGRTGIYVLVGPAEDETKSSRVPTSVKAT